MTKNYDVYGISAADYPGHGVTCGCLDCTSSRRRPPAGARDALTDEEWAAVESLRKRKAADADKWRLATERERKQLEKTIKESQKRIDAIVREEQRLRG